MLKHADPAFAETGGPPWTSPALYPEKPDISEYGYILGNPSNGATPVPCSWDHLRSLVAWDDEKTLKLVWTPESDRLVPPEEVHALIWDVRHRAELNLKKQLRSNGGSLAIHGVGALVIGFSITRGNGWPASSLFLFLALSSLASLLDNIWSLRKIRAGYTWEDSLAAGEDIRYAEWLGDQRTPLTWWLLGGITAVGVVQLVSSVSAAADRIFGDGGEWSAIEAAGLVKPAVWEGEWWRLFTATVMHGSIFHFLFNMVALLVLGKVVEALAGRAYLALVFLVSALSGSLLSLLLLPATSVGSSGGIMGLVGFLLALGYTNRHLVPRGFFRTLLGVVGWTAVLGAAAFNVIDNPAHLGGLLGGIILGLLLVPRKRGTVPFRRVRGIEYAGVISGVTIGLTIAGSITAMLLWT